MYIGEDMILPHARRDYRMTCLTFLDALALSHVAMREVFDTGEFDQQAARVRKAACWMYLRASFRMMARGDGTRAPTADVATNRCGVNGTSCMSVVVLHGGSRSELISS